MVKGLAAADWLAAFLLYAPPYAPKRQKNNRQQWSTRL